MRPIHKGSSPYKSIKNYSEAKPYLREVIGEYCCYCEFPIFHVPEVDHIVSKSKDGDMTDWNNLLFSCKYCNTHKGNSVDRQNVDEYMWPDKYNTGLAFSYENVRPGINKDKLDLLDPTGSATRLAENIFNLVKLGDVPDETEKSKEKYKRFWQREETRSRAKDCLNLLKSFESKNIPISDETIKLIVEMAISNGFFSIWMFVFQDYPEVLSEFINAFPGTEKRYYEKDGRVKMILQCLC